MLASIPSNTANRAPSAALSPGTGTPSTPSFTTLSVVLKAPRPISRDSLLCFVRFEVLLLADCLEVEVDVIRENTEGTRMVGSTAESQPFMIDFGPITGA